MSTLGFASVQLADANCFASVDPQFAKSGAPARMADGRIMTDYRPRCFQYPVVAAREWGVESYRKRMIDGADELMTAAQNVNNRKVTPTSCEDTMVPELYKRVCKWDGCKTVPGNFQGIGVGRIYVPTAVGSASNPQALSDISVPTLPRTYARQPPRVGSQCAVNDPETSYNIHGPAATFGSSAKTHPYSAPRN